MKCSPCSSEPVALPQIKGFIENTLIDWPGRIAAEVFLAGCNFRCPFCHAGHLVLRPNTLESIPFETVRAALTARGEWIDGVVISGGEPTTCKELPALIDAFAAMGYPVKLDTNGSAPDVLESLIDAGTIAAVSMDVKGPLDERYDRLAGVAVDLAAIRRSIALLMSGRIAEVEFRTTVPPGYLDEEAVIDIARSIEGAPAYVLQAFKSGDCLEAAMNEVRSIERDMLKPWVEKVQAYVKHCWVRGTEEISPDPGGG